MKLMDHSLYRLISIIESKEEGPDVLEERPTNDECNIKELVKHTWPWV